MKHLSFSLATTGGLALALAACGDAADDEVIEAEPIEDVDTVAVVTYDPMTRDYALTPDQRQRRDAYDMDAMQTEFAGYHDEIVAEGGASGGTGDAAGSMNAEAGTTDAADQNNDAMASTSGASNSGDGAAHARSIMNWAYLDRNDDEQLSVAEYAIWALPMDPTEPVPNDTAPYLTSEEANKVADSFFFYDRDGNTYLSEQEFAAARRGDTVG